MGQLQGGVKISVGFQGSISFGFGGVKIYSAANLPLASGLYFGCLTQFKVAATIKILL